MENNAIEKRFILELFTYGLLSELPNVIYDEPQKRPKYITSKKARLNEQGRNEPCKCGSGIKYKKCCQKK